MVRALLRNNASTSLLDQGGATALQLAAQQGCTECLHQLMDARSPIAATNMFGWDALHEAAYHGRTSAVVLLLNARVDVFHADNEGPLPSLTRPP